MRAAILLACGLLMLHQGTGHAADRGAARETAPGNALRNAPEITPNTAPCRGGGDRGTADGGKGCGHAADPVAALIARMTLAEKIGQLQSSAPAIPRLGISAYDWWSEGLHGVARAGAATVFPQAIGLAASFDPDLLGAIGADVAREARTKFMATGWHADHARFQGLTIWSPNVNIDRDPRWGRGQETYGEDPWLTGRLARAFITGLQGPDPARPLTAASVKHFAAHSGPEDGRYGLDVDISAADLAQTYLPAFREAVRAGTRGVMCAYNAIGGHPDCGNPALLRETLRAAWGFDGVIVSDCDAVRDIARFHHAAADLPGAAAMALEAGVDLDCGDAYAALAQARRTGLVTQGAIDRALYRLFAQRRALGWTPGTGDPPAGPYPVDTRGPAAHALALRAAEESFVLLANRDGALPLPPHPRLAAIGPNCDAPMVMAANYHGTSPGMMTVLDGLRARFGAVAYAQGAPVAEGVPITVPRSALSVDGARGLDAEYAPLDLAPSPSPAPSSTPSSGPMTRSSRTEALIDDDWDHVPPAPGIATRHWSARWHGTITIPQGGAILALGIDRCFDCAGHDSAELAIDGVTVLRLGADDGGQQATPRALSAGPHAIRIRYLHQGEDQGLHLRWTPDPRALLDGAVAASRDADTLLVCTGLAPEVEGEALAVRAPGFEGGDRTDIALPAPQRALLERLRATGRRIVVLNFGGAAIGFGDIAATAGAIMQLWYPGEAGAEALARVLAGDDAPSGRLPVSFYRDLSSLPPFGDYAMRDVLGARTYRYATTRPQWPFGFGLGYGAVRIGPTRVAGGTVSATLRNAGGRDDVAVAQLYVVPPPGADRPRLRLVGVTRIALRARETRAVAVDLPDTAFETTDAHGRASDTPGRFAVVLALAAPVGEDVPHGAAMLDHRVSPPIRASALGHELR